jgi:hypothetical protein
MPISRRITRLLCDQKDVVFKNPAFKNNNRIILKLFDRDEKTFTLTKPTTILMVITNCASCKKVSTHG